MLAKNYIAKAVADDTAITIPHNMPKMTDVITPAKAPFPALLALSGVLSFHKMNNIKPTIGKKKLRTPNPVFGASCSLDDTCGFVSKERPQCTQTTALS